MKSRHGYVGAFAALLLCGCTGDVQAPDTVKITLAQSGDGTVKPSGILYVVTVSAKATAGDAAGVDVGLSTNVAGLAFDPASVTTGIDGTATTQLLVPFSANVVATALAPDGTVDVITLSAPAISITQLSLTADSEPAGSLITLQVKATSSGQPAQGIPLTFASNAATATFNPATITTDASGNATSRAFVPFGAAVNALVSGGGANAPFSLSATLGTVTFDTPVVSKADAGSAGAIPTNPQNGVIYMVKIAVRDAQKNLLTAMPVTFAELGTTTSANLFAPTTALTDSTGTATTFVFIGNAADGSLQSIICEATADGFSKAFIVGGQP